ncbi:MAG: asparagine synthase (glutamine-hydrolyzing) [Bacteroidota bacterium]
MCGIAGIWNLCGRAIDGSSVVQRMNDRLRHRGPDDEGIWKDQQSDVTLGHRRLSILDLSASGHQPMTGRDGRTIVFNGEIFNYAELRNKYFSDIALSTSGDTGVLLLMLERFGLSALDQLTGMFAFAMWDPSKEELLLVRDRAGKKPLYYLNGEGVFAFASEVGALFEIPGVRPQLDEEALYDFLTFNLLSPPKTMFKGIRKLPPAHWLRISKNGDHTYGRYWSPAYTDLSSLNEQALCERTLELLRKAVGYRTVSDVPVGAFLSGGVDSSAVVALMSEKSTSPVRTYSIGFEGQHDYDERHFAEIVSKKFGTVHHERIVHAEEIRALLPEIVSHLDEPLADATCIPIHFLSQQARADGTPVVLTGDGADELFAGYRNWKKYATLYPYYNIASKAPRPLRSLFDFLGNKLASDHPVAEMLHRAHLRQEFYWGGAKSFKETRKKEILSDQFFNDHSHADSYSVIEEFRRRFEVEVPRTHHSPLDWMCYLGFHFNIPNYYLHRMDRLGMAHAVEIRTPFLDHRLVEFALSVDPKFKLFHGQPKHILKKSLEKILPHEILYRKKRGFNVPLREWAGDILIDGLEKGLKSFCAELPIFREEGLLNLLDRLKKGDKSVTNRLWTVYFLMNWYRKWLH